MSVDKGRIARLLPFVRVRARRFTTDRSGASAVEFAIVALPFIAVVFAVIEFAILLLASESLNFTASLAARTVMTGQAQTAGLTQATFKQAVCANLSPLFSCSNLYVNVINYSSFSSASVTPPTLSNGNLDTSSLSYSPGTAGSVVVVQLYYKMPIYVSLLNAGIINQTDNTNLLVATTVLQNEPYQ